MQKAVPKDVLDRKTQILLDDFGKFFLETDGVTSIDFDPFWLWFRIAHPKLDDNSQKFYAEFLKDVMEDVPQGLEDGILARLVAAKTVSNLTDLVTAYNDEQEIDVGAALRAEVDKFESETAKKVKTPEVQDDICDLLEEDETDTGFHFRKAELNASMRPLRSGDAGIIAGRPDIGKTTLLADELTFFAPQVDRVYPPLNAEGKPDPNGTPQNRSILWFNNEGPGRRIKQRLYQSALNASISDLIQRKQAGTIHQDYIAATGGRPDVIRVFDIHDFWNHEVEDIIRRYPPAVIVFDMVDNIRFSGGATNGGQRTDQVLEEMYKWARVIAVKYDCVVIMTSQVSADGEGLAYPTLSMLKDSKTGKQGAADWIMTIGMLLDFPNTRHLGLTKNKLAREGGPKNPKVDCHFDGLRGRYVPISEGGGI